MRHVRTHIQERIYRFDPQIKHYQGTKWRRTPSRQLIDTFWHAQNCIILGDQWTCYYTQIWQMEEQILHFFDDL